jgi:hypothetical protein
MYGWVIRFNKVLRLLRRMGIKPIIKPRRNAKADSGPSERRTLVIMLKAFGKKKWGRDDGL